MKIEELSALELLEIVHAGALSVTEVARAYVSHIAAMEPQIHAWAHFDADQVMTSAAQLDGVTQRGPLHGLPVAVKDVMDTAQNGLYAPGQLRLRALAEQLGVSPVPVREALRRLEAEGLVVFGPNRRISVNTLSEAESREIFTIRINLETLALRHALPGLRSSPQRLMKLKKLIDKMDDYENKPDEWQLTNQAFHRELYAAAEMPRLVGMISSLWSLHQPYLRLFVNSVKSFSESQEEHRQILEHVIVGEAEEAISLLEQHLLMTAEIVRNRILAREAAQLGTQL